MVRYKINAMPIKDKEYANLPIGRQAEYGKLIKAFKESAKHNAISVKSKSFNSALSYFLKLYQVDQFYIVNDNTPEYYSDSLEIWYTTK